MDGGHQLGVTDRGDKGIPDRTGGEVKAKKGALLGVDGPH